MLFDATPILYDAINRCTSITLALLTGDMYVQLLTVVICNGLSGIVSCNRLSTIYIYIYNMLAVLIYFFSVLVIHALEFLHKPVSLLTSFVQ